MDLTKVQIIKRAWNIKNKEYKRRWDRKNRPWKFNIKILKETDPEKYKIILEKRRKWDKKYKAKPEVKEKQKIYVKRYREKKKLDPIWVEKEKNRIRTSRYNPLAAKKNREKHKKNKTQQWFSDSLRKIIYDIFRRRSSLEFKMLNSQELLGTDFEMARKHIESLFQPGMSWNNRSEWHIDHIIPCSSFDLKCPVQQKACCHYTNLQPLWASDNIRKGNRIISGDITSHKM